MITEDDVIACKQGRNRDLTIVQLFPDPKPSFDDGIFEIRQKYYAWCKARLGGGGDKWCTDGVTVFSYRILFVEEEDAMAFKLTFGL